MMTYGTEGPAWYRAVIAELALLVPSGLAVAARNRPRNLGSISTIEADPSRMKSRLFWSRRLTRDVRVTSVGIG
jgi:hypothetical protein